MAKYKLEFTPYKRKDPVTGKKGDYMRNAHSDQTSKRLKEFQGCIRGGMTGFHPNGTTSRQRSQQIREKFAETATACKK